MYSLYLVANLTTAAVVAAAMETVAVVVVVVMVIIFLLREPTNVITSVMQSYTRDRLPFSFHF